MSLNIHFWFKNRTNMGPVLSALLLLFLEAFLLLMPLYCGVRKGATSTLTPNPIYDLRTF